MQALFVSGCEPCFVHWRPLYHLLWRPRSVSVWASPCHCGRCCSFLLSCAVLSNPSWISCQLIMHPRPTEEWHSKPHRPSSSSKHGTRVLLRPALALAHSSSTPHSLQVLNPVSNDSIRAASSFLNKAAKNVNAVMPLHSLLKHPNPGVRCRGGELSSS